MSPLAVATIVAKNYVSFARVLARSFRQYHADVPFFVLLTDEVDGYFDPGAEPFRLLRLEEISIPNLQRFLSEYSRKQVAVASKPYLLSHLLDRGFRHSVFLDPDILVLRPLDDLFSHVRRYASLLVPHLLAPLEGGDRIARELNILQSGVYNGGCIGISDTPGARRFLRWWQDRVGEHCRCDVAHGMYYDQRWLDLATVLFDDIHVLRDPTYNVAHWNLPERDVRLCSFLHFSGFDPDRPHAVSRYSTRLDMSNVGGAAPLFRRYLTLLEQAGFHQTKHWPYAYGIGVGGLARQTWRAVRTPLAPRAVGRRLTRLLHGVLDRPTKPTRPSMLERPAADRRRTSGNGKASTAAATVVAKNCVSFARVLAVSFLRHHPNVPFFTLLADEVDGYFDPASEPFRLLRLEEIGIPQLATFRSHYGQQELTYAATPYLLRHLLDQGFGAAVFLKQESLVVSDLTPVLDLLRRHSIVLVPHLLEPLEGSNGVARELNVLQSGLYNVGFLGVSDTRAARAFLTWWEDRVYEHCRHDVPRGMHFEQRWLDLVPAFFEDVHIVRDPGVNVGHWNLPERDVTVCGEEVRVNGGPCRFFRFSGFEPDRPHAVTRYSPRLNMSNVGPAAQVFRRYLALLEQAGYHETRHWPYAYTPTSAIGRLARLVTLHDS